ncbi:MAG: glycosyltransferase 87 family protein [Ignisphaera sp.]|nr:glycosyltransferase 87 family protein [Ignisphaera sp.]MDW8086108.1 glycosyltransferase 87 family protein [Ignisphaera sp.]
MQALYHSGNIVMFTHKQRRALLILSIVMIIASLNVGMNYYDMMWWISWFKIVQENGISSLISIYALCSTPGCKVPYLPFAVLIFIAGYAFVTAVPYAIRYVVLKLILVMIPSIIIFHILKKYRGLDVAILWLLSLPFLQILIVLQFDVLIAMFIMLSTLYFLLNKSHYTAFFTALATLIKPVAAVTIPLHIFLMVIRKEYKQCFRYLALLALTLAVFILPFFIASPNKFIENTVLFHSSRAPQDLSLWAVITVFEESRIVEELNFIDNLWLVPFLACYSLLFMILYKTSRIQDAGSYVYQPALHSVVVFVLPLLFLIMFNKVGNFNYIIWIVPTSLLVLNPIYIKRFYMLMSLVVLLGSLPYAIMLILLPASAGAPVFIVEDLSYWDARALIMQSINYYFMYILSLLQAYITIPLTNFLTPAEMLRLLSYTFLEMSGLRKVLLIMIIIVSQTLLTITSLFYLTAMFSHRMKGVKILPKG